MLKSNIGWSVSFVLAAISSVGLAYWGGEVGERKQNDQFEPNTILGIRPLHWSWLWFMGSAYLAFMFHVALRWCLIPGDSISGLLAFIPVIAYGFPMVVMYEILSGEILAEKHAIIKVLAFIGVYVAGLILGTGTDFICSKINFF